MNEVYGEEDDGGRGRRVWEKLMSEDAASEKSVVIGSVGWELFSIEKEIEKEEKSWVKVVNKNVNKNMEELIVLVILKVIVTHVCVLHTVNYMRTACCLCLPFFPINITHH